MFSTLVNDLKCYLCQESGDDGDDDGGSGIGDPPPPTPRPPSRPA